MRELVGVGFALLICLLWWIASGQPYVRRARPGKWVYGTRHGRLRFHLGSAPSWKDALHELNTRGTRT